MLLRPGCRKVSVPRLRGWSYRGWRRPVPYTGRTPHVQFAVSAASRPRFVTQMYVAGELQNEDDGVPLSVRDPAARVRLIVALRPAPEPAPGALAGTFDIVLG